MVGIDRESSPPAPSDGAASGPQDWASLVRALASRIQVDFERLELLYEALTHTSYVNESADPDVGDNERLEFLGDAVIDLLVSDALMRRYPKAREGQLSRMRARLVSETGLAKAAESIELGHVLRLGKGEERSGGRSKPSLLSDAFEALVAAIYLDRGMAAARAFLGRVLSIDDFQDLDSGDPKTQLQQRIQAETHQTPRYRVVEERGPDHAKTFVVELRIGDEVRATASGRSKKEAEQRAAAQCLADRER